LLTGRYQQRFGFDSISEGPLPMEEKTIADRLRAAGYATGMVGKWHLEPNLVCVAWAERQEPPLEMLRPGVVKLPRELELAYGPGPRGFRDFYWGYEADYWRNYDLEGRSLAPGGEAHAAKNYRIKEQTEAALAFLRRANPDPFFLYLAYYAPHVPLVAPEEYLARFPGDMPERRRTALAMIAAVDDGVGRILDHLDEKGLRENTLIFFASDNGAPLGAHEGVPMQDGTVETAGSLVIGSSGEVYRSGGWDFGFFSGLARAGAGPAEGAAAADGSQVAFLRGDARINDAPSEVRNLFGTDLTGLVPGRTYELSWQQTGHPANREDGQIAVELGMSGQNNFFAIREPSAVTNRGAWEKIACSFLAMSPVMRVNFRHSVAEPHGAGSGDVTTLVDDVRVRPLE
jgi:hypothetical protein